MIKTTMMKTYNFAARAGRNLCTFNTSYMEAEAHDIFSHYAPVNAVDSHAYPELDFIKLQCASFLLNLLHGQCNDDYHYFTTSGSSESVFLALLTLKRRHKQLNRPASKPNIIIGANSHITWHKAAKYLDIDIRIASFTSAFIIDTEQVMALIDEHTIGVCCTLGAPTTLLCDNILAMNRSLVQHQQNTGQFIPIHVDAASGGFVVPFVSPATQFDFSLPHVFSINISSHKYGLVYPSLGWLFMRHDACIDELLDENDYLGAAIKHFSMQFSHSAAHLMTQYHYIQTLGRAGYQDILAKLFGYCRQLKDNLIRSQTAIEFIASTDPALPGLVFSIPDQDMVLLSQKLKEKNWYLPVYSLARPGSTQLVARIVVRYGYDDAFIDYLSTDIDSCINDTSQKNRPVTRGC